MAPFVLQTNAVDKIIFLKSVYSNTYIEIEWTITDAKKLEYSKSSVFDDSIQSISNYDGASMNLVHLNKWVEYSLS